MRKLSASGAGGHPVEGLEGDTVGNPPSARTRLRKAAGVLVTLVGIMFGLVSPSDALSD